MTSPALIESAIALHPHEESRVLLREMLVQNMVLQDRVDGLVGTEHPGLPEWGLTRKEAEIARLTAARPRITHGQIMQALYAERVGDSPDTDIVKVFMCKIRKKLRPFEIEIETIWGMGYQVTGESRTKLRAGFELEESE